MTQDDQMNPPGAEEWGDHEANLGARVRELRIARGWSQADLAARLAAWGWPMHQTTVAKLETGGRPVRINEAAALASIFEVRLPDLLGSGADAPPDDLALASRRARVLEAELAGALKALATIRRELVERESTVANLKRELESVYADLARRSEEAGRPELASSWRLAEEAVAARELGILGVHPLPAGEEVAGGEHREAT